MFLQAVEIMGKCIDQEKVHPKTILQRNFIKEDCSA